MRKFTFNPVATPNGGVINTQIPGGSLLKVILMNLSPTNLTLQFSDGSTVALVSQDRRLFELNGIPNGNINWSIDSYVGSIFPGLSLVVVEVYQPYEKIAEIYPSPVPSLAPPNLHLISDNLANANQHNKSVPVVSGQLYYLTQLEYRSRLGAAPNDVSITVDQGHMLSNPSAQQLSWYLAESTTEAIDFTYVFPSPYVQFAANTAITAVSLGATAPQHILRLWGYYL